MGCAFGYSFLGPLLQRSPWTDNLLQGQIRESKFVQIHLSIKASVAHHNDGLCMDLLRAPKAPDA